MKTDLHLAVVVAATEVDVAGATHVEPPRVRGDSIRVPDCEVAYATLRDRGAEFLTPPYDWGGEVRCFFRDPDGHLLEISEAPGEPGRSG